MDYVCIHPFNDGNGRTSRLLTSLLLYRIDCFVGKYISLEKLIEENKEGYYETLQQVGENGNLVVVPVDSQPIVQTSK